MNKTERAFAELLRHAGGIHQWGRESLTFRLAGRTRYTPDFAVWPYAYPLVLVEIKGRWIRDDAAVKLKVAAEMYPRCQWWLVRREGRHGWQVLEVTSRGIGTTPIIISWIHA